jgi:hypothetical protein
MQRVHLGFAHQMLWNIVADYRAGSFRGSKQTMALDDSRSEFVPASLC